MTDSPEARRAKEEGIAERRAGYHIPVRVADTPVMAEVARDLGRKVLRDIKKHAGISDTEVKVVETTMRAWLRYLQKSEKAIADFRKSKGISEVDRQQLIEEVYSAQEEVRQEMFGE